MRDSKTVEVPINTSKFKWKIFKEEEARKLNIQLLKLDEDKAMLLIDLAYIPHGMCIADYLDWIQDTGVALNLTEPKSHQ